VLCKHEVIGSIPFTSTTLRSSSFGRHARKRVRARSAYRSFSVGMLRNVRETDVGRNHLAKADGKPGFTRFVGDVERDWVK
jgi:hypothetical protein